MVPDLCLLAPGALYLRRLTQECGDRAGLGRVRRLPPKGDRNPGQPSPSVSRRSIQPAQSSQFQHSEPNRIYPEFWPDFKRSGLPPAPIRVEAAVLNRGPFAEASIKFS